MHWDDPANRCGQDPYGYATESEQHYQAQIEFYTQLLEKRRAVASPLELNYLDGRVQLYQMFLKRLQAHLNAHSDEPF